MADVAFHCPCGRVKGVLQAADPAHANRTICHCQFCRAGVAFGGEGDPGAAGTDLVLTTPDRIKVTEGSFLLEPFAFGPKNMLRWRASCCGVMVFATQRSPRFPLASVLTRRLAELETVGPVVSRGFIPKANGKVKHENHLALVKSLLRALRARVTGRWRQTPFFDPDTGMAVAPIIEISREERKALLTG